jgi:hypothetical protein
MIQQDFVLSLKKTITFWEGALALFYLVTCMSRHTLCIGSPNESGLVGKMCCFTVKVQRPSFCMWATLSLFILGMCVLIS